MSETQIKEMTQKLRESLKSDITKTLERIESRIQEIKEQLVTSMDSLSNQMGQLKEIQKEIDDLS